MTQYQEVLENQKTHGRLKRFNISGKTIQNNLRKFGGFMAGMIMPLIGVIIAWGLYTAIILGAKSIIMANNNINEWNTTHSRNYLANMDTIIDYGIKWVIPILIGFFAGYQIHKVKGGLIGVVSSLGVIGGSFSPLFNEIMVKITGDVTLRDANAPVMILGVMVMAPIAAILFKLLEKAYSKKIPSGFEMLINNLSIGLFGLAMLFIGFWGFSNISAILQSIFYIIIKGINDKQLLWLLPLFIETEKVLFLNNAVNHGILGPLGYQEVDKFGQSALFFLDPNPGTGMGLLIAYFLFGNKNEKAQSGAAMPIHFIGGIHEVYYPFVLVKPLNLLWMIAGGTFAAVIYQVMGVGGLYTPSPGSVIMNYLALNPAKPMNYAGLSVAIFGSLAITCALTSAMIIFERISKGEKVYVNPITAMQVYKVNKWLNVESALSINQQNQIESIEYVSNDNSSKEYEWEIVKDENDLVQMYIIKNKNKKIKEYYYFDLTKQKYKFLKNELRNWSLLETNERIELIKIAKKFSSEKSDNSKKYILKIYEDETYKMVKCSQSEIIIKELKYEEHPIRYKERIIKFKQTFKDDKEITKKNQIKKVWYLNKEESIESINKKESVVLTFDESKLDNNNLENLKNTKKIIFACEAGMGSSAMGAGIVRKILKNKGINDLIVINFAIKDLPPDAKVIICQNIFKDVVTSKHPNAYVYTIEQFLKSSEYDQLINEIVSVRK